MVLMSSEGATTEAKQAMGDSLPSAGGGLTSAVVDVAAASPTATARASEQWAFPAANLPVASLPLGWPHQDAAAASTTPSTAPSPATAATGGSSQLSPAPVPTQLLTASAVETPSQTQGPLGSSPLTPTTPTAVDVTAAVVPATVVSAAAVVTPSSMLRCPAAGCFRTFARRSTLTSHIRRHDVEQAGAGPKGGRGSRGGRGRSGSSGGGGSGESSPGGGSSSTGGTPPQLSTNGVSKPGGLDAARLHVCKLCGRRFARRTSVTNHERSHYNERSLVNRRRRREAAAIASSSEDLVALGSGRRGGRWPEAAPVPAAAASPAPGRPPTPPPSAVIPSAEIDTHPSSRAPTSNVTSIASPLKLGLSAAWGTQPTATAAAVAAGAAGGSPSEAHGGPPPRPLPPPPATAVSWFDVTPLSQQVRNVTSVSSTGGTLGQAEGQLGPPAIAASAYELGVAAIPARMPSHSALEATAAPSTQPWRPAGALLPPLMPSPPSPATSYAGEGAGAGTPNYQPSPLESMWVGPSAAPSGDRGMPDRSSGGVGGGEKAVSGSQAGPTGLVSDGDATDRGSLVSVAAAAVEWLDANPPGAGITALAGTGLSAEVPPGTGGASPGVTVPLEGRGWGGTPEPAPGGEDNMGMVLYLNRSFPPRDDMMERTLQELFEL